MFTDMERTSRQIISTKTVIRTKLFIVCLYICVKKKKKKKRKKKEREWEQRREGTDREPEIAFIYGNVTYQQLAL